jgi:excisionase family DNA binding protein
LIPIHPGLLSHRAQQTIKQFHERDTQMNTDSLTVLISAEELAEMLRISERTLWRLLSAGQIPKPVRIGRSTRWRAAEIRIWIDSGCKVNPA